MWSITTSLARAISKALSAVDVHCTAMSMTLWLGKAVTFITSELLTVVGWDWWSADQPE